MSDASDSAVLLAMRTLRSTQPDRKVVAVIDQIESEVEGRAEARREVVREFVQWVASNRAYNGSDYQRGQSLYNECLNGVLGLWAEDFLAELSA